jgi:catechol 2,3-dioxygenase-like lactoylglutathione lyase family enzyme
VDQVGLRSDLQFRTSHARAACAIILVLSCASTASAQLLAAKDGPIVYGHHHIAASDVPAHLQFFADTLGGTVIKFGPQQIDVVKFPNVFIFFRNQKPTGGSKGTTVNHIGFSVTNLRQTLDRVKAAGYPIITRSEVAPTQQVIDDIAPVNATTSIAFVMGPDEVKVELLENTRQTAPIALHHVHFYGPQNTEMRAWYVKVFGAKPRDAANFPAADLPGVALNFSSSPEPVIGTTGRSIEHIGFEVKDLEAFCKKLEAMGITLNVSYRRAEALGLGVAFVTDPWGTSIELNEGLDKLN